jgi:HSP20 family protein
MPSSHDTDPKTRPTSTTLDRPGDVRRHQWVEPHRSWYELLDRLPFGFWAPPGGVTRSNWSRSSDAMNARWSPEVETFQRGDEFVVRADLPGLEKKDVTVDVQDDSLIIQGERSNEHREEREGYYASERSYGRFYRVIPLPEGAITDSVTASFRNGVLEVVTKAPPHEINRGRRVEITEGTR